MNYYITRLKLWFYNTVYGLGYKTMAWATAKCASVKNRADERNIKTRLLISEKSKQWRTLLKKSKALQPQNCVLRPTLISESGEVLIPEGSVKRMKKTSKN